MLLPAICPELLIRLTEEVTFIGWGWPLRTIYSKLTSISSERFRCAVSEAAHPSPEKGYTSTSGSIIFTKATFWTNAHWSRIWCLLIQNDPKLLRYLHKCRILCFFQWSPLCIFAEIQMADWLNLLSCFILFYPILLCRIRHLCKYLKSFG